MLLVRQLSGFHLIAIMCLALTTSCDTDDHRTFSVDPEIQLYFDRFEQEGLDRGIIVDFDAVPISGEFTLLLGPNILGSCTDRDNKFNRIRINHPYWDGIGDLAREYLIFHELGHCYLNRDHLETSFANRNCRSIMASGTGTCFENYTEDTRKDYIDELFGI